MNNQGNNLRICFITSPGSRVGKIMSNFVSLLGPLYAQMYIISDLRLDAEKVGILTIGTPPPRNFLPYKAGRNLFMQLRICRRLAQILRKIDVVILFARDPFPLPVLLAKLFHKAVIIIPAGLVSHLNKIEGLDMVTRYFIYNIHRALEHIVFMLADQIAVESLHVTGFYGLDRFRKKIHVCGGPTVDITEFSVRRALRERENVIGYIGGITAAKGVANLVEAIPLIAKENGNVKFLLVGEGNLLEDMKKATRRYGLEDRVTFTGWISYDDLPEYFNRVHLFVLPSYTEGLPQVVEEAMCCGTPVLATPVGGVPDLIKDGETGFIMEDNSPESIAKNAARALKHPRLEEIAQNARKLIEREYSYEAVVGRWRVALNKLSEGKK